MNTDARVDDYIAAAAPFARPVLEQLRAVVHAACPEATETLKWRMPFFEYRGRPLCMMAAFKQHCGFGFWQPDAKAGDADGMGQYGKLTAVGDLPPKRALMAAVKAAMQRIETGAPSPRSRAAARSAPAVPEDLAAALALRKHAAARRHFEAFSPSAQREYTDWITGAKTDATRSKRLATTLEWLAEGKHRNWKYM
ncbi:YdeI/OmpD-associated family protein [Dyella sp.]|uniref:YdeI/OmpD-associated family protein n=1 Tax=Dyella sp. TaxID=1869338 RepID=UPI003F81F9EC